MQGVWHAEHSAHQSLSFGYHVWLCRVAYERFWDRCFQDCPAGEFGKPEVHNQSQQFLHFNLFQSINLPSKRYPFATAQIMHLMGIFLIIFLISLRCQMQQQFKVINTWFATNSIGTSHRFPFSLFYGMQASRLYQNFNNFVGGMLEFPVYLFNKPLVWIHGVGGTCPDRQSDFQAALNLCRYRTYRSDVI